MTLRNAELYDRTRALEAFTAFTEAAGVETDVLKLSQQAFQVLQGRFSDTSTSVYYEVEGEQFYARSWSEDIDDQPELLAALQQGTSLTAPLFAEAVETGGAAFTPAWDPTREQIAYTEAYGAAAVYPLIVYGRLCAFLGLGLRLNRNWTEQDEAVLRAVGRGLTLALERAEVVKQLAQRQTALEQSNRQLQASNEELEAFTYSVSHDLRTPVRHILSFGGLLRRSLPGPLGEKSERYFQIVETAATTLNELIDGMLDLSRTSRQPLKVSRVDLERLVGAVRKELSMFTSDRQITWQIAGLPTVLGDPDLLRRVMMALLSNAVKYTRTRAVAVIEVWAEEQPQNWRVLVRDNGVGFEAQYKGKLFSMFQRLHRQEEYEGAGVGLANVRRIVTRHGGTVLAGGQSGVGATFGFTLPKVVVEQ